MSKHGEWDPQFGPMPNMVVLYGAVPEPGPFDSPFTPLPNMPWTGDGGTAAPSVIPPTVTITNFDPALIAAELKALREIVAELLRDHPRVVSVEVTARREGAGVVVDRVVWERAEVSGG